MFTPISYVPRPNERGKTSSSEERVPIIAFTRVLLNKKSFAYHKTALTDDEGRHHEQINVSKRVKLMAPNVVDALKTMTASNRDTLRDSIECFKFQYSDLK
ncbi:hypothetical protein EVAR_50958_1 [Eumeta japonica]|uniref:Uncharacterized protein n=1 Tax=Eumeta variegata TaxID=151549 RepID=A0A4C1XDU3_EUMVA|nr:hypothetical protein EVAR_50958_1 [Eumeta japonica]